MNIKIVLLTITFVSFLLLAVPTWPVERITATALQPVLPLNIDAVANSEKDFSGVQGDKNWFYGYYSNPVDASSFLQIPEFSQTNFGNEQNVPTWLFPDGEYWTRISAKYVHPNGQTTSGVAKSAEQWVARRWVSTVTGNIVVTGHLAKFDTRGGDGITGHLMIDGIERWSQFIAAADNVGVDFTIFISVNVGSKVDFVVSPGASDWNDTTSFTAVITMSGIFGKIYNEAVAAGNEVSGAFIEACPATGSCYTTTSSSNGDYQFVDLPLGTYNLRALPPANNHHLIGKLGPLSIAENSLLMNQHIILPKPIRIPPGTTIEPKVTIDDGVPSIFWRSPTVLTHSGCPSGVASYELIVDGTVVRSGNMTEVSPGNYKATLEPLYPLHGNLQITINLACPNDSPPPIVFNIWIDPSGLVVNTLGQPIGNATVSLYRSDIDSGPFDLIASGSGVMSPANRVNPMQTDNVGYFGWDVIAGYYKVRAEKSGCVAANNRTQSYVQTEVLIIPPPVTDLRLVLFCGEQRHLFLPLVHR